LVQDYPVLRIRQNGNELECELAEPTSMQIVRIRRKNVRITKALKRIPSKYTSIVQMMEHDEPPNLRTFRLELRILGNEIGRVLTPILLGYLSKKLTMENEPKMLCDALCVGRLRVVEDKSWKQSPKRGHTTKALVVGIDYKDCRIGIGELDHAQEEAEGVQAILKNNDIPVTFLPGKEATRAKVIETLKQGVDIFHFTGHGSMSWNKSKICLSDEDLWAKDLSHVLTNTAAPSLSFFNACETCVDTPRKGKVEWAPYSWAYSFSKNGGNAFVGTLWSVLEKEALCFAQTFYQKFLGIRNNSLAKAMHQARNKIKKGKLDKIYSWPAYVLYGPPTLVRDDLMRN